MGTSGSLEEVSGMEDDRSRVPRVLRNRCRVRPTAANLNMRSARSLSRDILSRGNVAANFCDKISAHPRKTFRGGALRRLDRDTVVSGSCSIVNCSS